MAEYHVVLGTGAIGRATAQALIESGAQVRMVNRSGMLAEAPRGAQIAGADLTSMEDTRRVCAGAAAVYQCAQPAYYRWVAEFPAFQATIIDALEGSGSKLVLAENFYMYGETGGQMMTEETPYRAHTRKGQTRAAMSRAAMDAHAAGRVRVAIGRGSDYFGPWGLSTAMGDRVFYPLLAGKAAQATGRADQPHTFTFTKDFGRALAVLGMRSEADGQVWHVPNDQPKITQGELIRMIAEEMGVAPKMQAMGKMMMQLGGLFVPEAKETVEMMYAFEAPFVADSTKFERAFGMRATPLREAVKETVAWYRAHPQGK